MRAPAVLLALVFLLPASVGVAQEPAEVPAAGVKAWGIYPSEWQGPGLYEQIISTRDLAPEERATVIAEWMQGNDWRSAKWGLCDLYNLYDVLDVDTLEYSQFSARWSGFLTAPESGSYILNQARDYSDRDSHLKVTIDGKVVLDSGRDQLSDAERFTSQTVNLVAGEAMVIEVEMVHDVPPPIAQFSGGAPMALLTWKMGQGPEEIIPSASFTPPQGFASPDAKGLKGEYFRTTDFNEPCLTRLDAALDHVWSTPPVACLHEDLAQECLAKCKEKVLNGDFLEQSVADQKKFVFDYNLWRIAYRMTGSERKQLVKILLDRPDVLSEMSTRSMARLQQAFYMLPGNEHVTLLGEWSLQRPQPRSQAGAFPGWSEGSYQQLNTDFYWLMGLFKQGPYWDQVEQLWEDYLILPNGECNLTIAYATAYATREEMFRRDGHHIEKYYDRIQKQLDDESVIGDKRVTWLLARIFMDEVSGVSSPSLTPDSEYLVEARLVAESADYRFWALQETAVRYASLGDTSSLEALLDTQVGDAPEHQAEIDKWRTVAASQEIADEGRRELEVEQTALSVISELQRQLVNAQQRQDQADVKHYQKLITSAQAAGND